MIDYAMRYRKTGYISAKEVSILTGASYRDILAAIRAGDLQTDRKRAAPMFPPGSHLITMAYLFDWLSDIDMGTIKRPVMWDDETINRRIEDLTKPGQINRYNFRA